MDQNKPTQIFWCLCLPSPFCLLYVSYVSWMFFLLFKRGSVSLPYWYDPHHPSLWNPSPLILMKEHVVMLHMPPLLQSHPNTVCLYHLSACVCLSLSPQACSVYLRWRTGQWSSLVGDTAVRNRPFSSHHLSYFVRLNPFFKYCSNWYFKTTLRHWVSKWVSFDEAGCGMSLCFTLCSKWEADWDSLLLCWRGFKKKKKFTNGTKHGSLS